jgi:hypothetical protein
LYLLEVGITTSKLKTSILPHMRITYINRNNRVDINSDCIMWTWILKSDNRIMRMLLILHPHFHPYQTPHRVWDRMDCNFVVELRR